MFTKPKTDCSWLYDRGVVPGCVFFVLMRCMCAFTTAQHVRSLLNYSQAVLVQCSVLAGMATKNSFCTLPFIYC